MPPGLMDISLSGEDLALRTAFSEASDLVQVFRGIREGNPRRNCPVDFRLAGLQRRGHRDIWHVDQVLAFSTDECAPLVINGEDIGGNHGHPCGVIAQVKGHGKTCKDIGTLWRDEAGVLWTLLRTEDEDRLLFLSENIGPSPWAYAFAHEISGRLSSLDVAQSSAELTLQGQSGRHQLTRAIRHLRRELWYLKNDTWQRITSYHEGCQGAKILEEYEIINPATVAGALRDGRPQAGYACEQSLAVGEAMAIHRMTYRIDAEGTILCDFDHETCQPVHMPWYQGIMHQEKCDVSGGGVWRYIPKLLPFTHRGDSYDFSRPCNTTKGPMPDSRTLTRDLWAVPDSPPDRQLDFICREDGSCLAAFASGFLPLFDGTPKRRSRQITDAGSMVASRKTYPTFAGGKDQLRFPERESVEEVMNLRSMRGVAYKKYFPLQDRSSSAYTVRANGSTYAFFDFFDEMAAQRLPLSQGVRLLEISPSLTWRQEDEALVARGKKGYAVFVTLD